MAFGKVAETIGQYVVKGQEIYIDGRIEYRQWEKDGEKKYMTEIMINTFQFGAKAHGTSNESNKVEEEKDIEYPEEDINPEDIPF